MKRECFSLSSVLDRLIEEKIKEAEDKLIEYKLTVNELRFLIEIREMSNIKNGEENEKNIY